ncbi:M20 family metallo-hydrolase [Erwinia sp. MMLR14_017]|uniref:M20 family metallo-hydrolase n=1 Tax=Erwinia sp. MMLR14_017 TaxID=3093842 RepID=UPI00298F5261|nr:M20 family metallo-hydrolase [Erwinia sp. MMLR14_017]MDW8847811.1 M20 family metallo-hydrolase [Erwinia sp. MMLR14_017]
MSLSSIPALLRMTQYDYQAFDALFAQSCEIGATPAGGLHRLTASAEDGAMRDAFCHWLRQQGFSVHVDEIGNIFGLLALCPGAPWLLCGSHLDSQPAGGRFDGAYGVTAGATALSSLARQLKERDEDARLNLAVVSWTNEEGARFQPSLIGSAVFTGASTLEKALACKDAEGITLGEALEIIGYRGEPLPPMTLAAYVEIHIEQGPHLEQQQKQVGVVSETWAALKWQVAFRGEQNHTGPSLMASRRDALLAAAKTIVAVREEADRHGLALHTSVGRLETSPNSPNVVTSEATLYIEFRSADEALLRATGELFSHKLQTIAQETATDVSLISSLFRQRQQLDARLAQRAQKLAHELGLSSLKMQTVAGHDAVSLSASCPSCLLFVPSRDGLSHNECEFTAQEELHRGLDLLLALLADICLFPDVEETA